MLVPFSMIGFVSRYKKHKIDRAQIQFSGSLFSDQEVIDQAINHDRGEIIHYELEVFIREKRRWKLHEMLFYKIINKKMKG